MPVEAKAPRNVECTVYGDLMSEKSSENYPTMVLCPDCIGSYEIIHENGPSNDDCEECGEES